MKLFLFLLFLKLSFQVERKLLSIKDFKIENLDFTDIAFEAQTYFDQQKEQIEGLLPYKFVNKNNDIIIQLDDEQVGFIQVEKLLVDIKWIVQIEFQIVSKEYLYQQAYSVDSRVQNMLTFDQGWRNLLRESIDFVTQKIEEHMDRETVFFPEDFEDKTLKKIIQNFSKETFQEQKFDVEKREIVDEENPSEINCESKSNPSAFFYMFVCHNKDFKIFEITFCKQNEDLVHIYTYTPHQDNEYYQQYNRFKNEEDFDNILLTSFDAIDESKTYTKLNFENFAEIVQAAFEDQSVEMFGYNNILQMKEICDINFNKIELENQNFYSIEIQDQKKDVKKDRKLKINEETKILRTEKFNKNLSQIKYLMPQMQRELKLKEKKCPLNECSVILGEIFMESFHYYQMKINCKQLTADHYISFQDPNQIVEKVNFIVQKVTNNIHQWNVINTELKDVKKEYNNINFYFMLAEKLTKENGLQTTIKRQPNKIIFMNKDRSQNLFVIFLAKDKETDDTKVTIHFYYPPELRSTAHLRDELTVSANKHMKQEIYIEDALNEYLETIEDDHKNIII